MRAIKCSVPARPPSVAQPCRGSGLSALVLGTAASSSAAKGPGLISRRTTNADPLHFGTGLCGHQGRNHAIPARLDRAMHQSSLRSPRALVARRCHPSPGHRRALPFLWRLSAQRSAAVGAPSDAPACAHGAPAASTPSLKNLTGGSMLLSVPSLSGHENCEL
jgi:hypothetical protein